MPGKSDSGVKDVIKQVYDMWEKSAGEQLEKLVRSQGFLTALAQNLEGTLNLSGRVKEVTQTTLNIMSLPTRQDIEALAKQMRIIRNTVEEINEKMEEINEKLATLMPPPAPVEEEKPAPKAPSTKKAAAKPKAPKTGTKKKPVV